MARLSLVLIALASLLASAAFAGDVVGWRTDGTGAYPDANPTVEWAPDKNVVWAIDMPNWSNATPVLVGGKIFVCSEPSDLICVNAADGAILWKASNTYADVKAADPNAEVPAKVPPTQGNNGYTSFTPVSDGVHVWAAFGNGVLACYDLDGKRQWIQFTCLPPKNNSNWGTCSSPVLVDGKLLLHIEPLNAYDPATGKLLWSQPKANWSWATPFPVKVGEVTVVVDGGGSVVRVSDGEIMPARLPKLAYNSPLVVGDVAYMIQKNGGAFKLSDADGQVKAEKLWTAEVSKDRHYGTPVLANGLLFDVDQKGNLAVLDAATGEIVHTRNLELGKGTCYPSPTLAGKVVLLSMDNGTTKVLKAEKTAEEVATNHLPIFRSTPVFAGERMYLRAYKKLYCIGR